MPELRAALARVPARTALGYLVVGILWIVLSDAAIALITDDPRDAARIQMWKGWGFILVTALAVYWVLAHNLRLVLASQAGHQAQAALLEAVVASTTDAVFVKDLDGRYVLANDAAAAMLGTTRERLVGRTDAELFSPADAESLRRNQQVVLESGGTVTFSETLRMGGEMRTLLATKGVVRDRDGRITGMMGISRDVTEQRRLEERSRQSQKMEAIGRLAGGVAHDFNNMLVVIGGNAELLLLDLPPGHPGHVLAEEIRSAARRAADLTRRLLATSRAQPLQPRAVALAEVVAGIMPMLDRLLGDDVTLRAEVRPGDGTIWADPSLVEQIILNLAVNARDAMPEGGTLTLAVRPQADPPGGAAGAYALLEVADTGVGMDDATRARIFEPFFTTKEPGGGTGLGLATVYAAVEQSGGAVEVESAPGRGTRFRVFLPRAEPAAGDPAAPEATAPAPPPVPCTETVLVAENDESVLRFAVAVLKRAGYRVLEARDGEEALRRVEAEGDAVQVVLTDVVMPVLGGRALAARLRAERPALPVIFMTGFDPETGEGRDLPPAENFLQKPFGPDVLVDAVRAALRRADPG